MITCTAALQLFERGKFLLTDPVSAYLPEFSDMTVLRHIDGKTEQVKAKNQITVGQLLDVYKRQVLYYNSINRSR